jgi:predicted ArsR family transcriptional regulator
MAIIRKKGRKSIAHFGIGAELEAKLLRISKAIEGEGDPSSDLLASILHGGADSKLAELAAQDEKIASLDERLNHLEAVVAQGFEAILAKLDESIRAEG